MNDQRRRMIAALASLSATPWTWANPAEWPSKPLRLILPYAAGGPTDVMARVIGARLNAALGQPVVIENKLGVGGNLGSEFVAKAPADGYTALYHSSGIAVTPALYKKMGYDPATDFAPVAMPASIPLMLVAGPALPAEVTNARQLVQYLKANSGTCSYGSGGIGNITHLAVELMLQQSGTRAVHVPYKGTAPAVTDVIGGRIHFALDAMSTALPFVRDKRVRAIAITGKQRAGVLPEVSTVAESVLPGFDASTWHCVLLPAATPRPIVARLNKEINAIVSDPEMVRQYAAQGVELQTSAPAEFEAFLRSEIKRWTTAARNAGVQPE